MRNPKQAFRLAYRIHRMVAAGHASGAQLSNEIQALREACFCFDLLLEETVVDFPLYLRVVNAAERVAA